MRIGLINTYSTNNVGDAAIYAAIDRMLPPHYENLGSLHGWKSDFSWSPTKEGRGADAFISVGGDIFNNARPLLTTRTFLNHLNALYRCAPNTMLFGQSIPRSCQGLSLRALASVMRRVGAVTVRDKRSYQLLSRLGVQAKLSADLAFALSSETRYEAAATELFEQTNIDPERSVVVSTRAFGKLYAASDEDTLRSLTRLCQRLSRRGHQVAVLRQSAVNRVDADFAAIHQLQQHVPNIKVLDLFSQADSISPWQLLIGVLALSNAAIGVRFHTNVLRMVAGRTPFNLYYSDKGHELSRRWQIPGTSVSSIDVDSAIAAIERSADTEFDHVAARSEVNNSFENALASITSPANVSAGLART